MTDITVESVDYSIEINDLTETITISSGLQGAPGIGIPVGGATNEVLTKVSGTDYDFTWSSKDATVTWGDVTGTLSNQTDLQTELDAKSDTTHNHDADYSDIAHNHTGVYEPADATILKDADIGGSVAAQSHNHVEADITDLQAYLLTISGESIKDLSDVLTTMTPTDGQVLTYDTTNGWQAETLPTDNDTTDHTLLSNIGTNTHAQIDTHIADSTVHFTQAGISITESQVSDLQSYLLNITGESIKDLSDVFSTMTPTDGQVLTYDTTNGWQAENSLSGVTDHGALTGLADDDHTQYHNDTRGDARYYTQTQVNSLIQDVTDSSVAMAIALG